MIPQIKELNFPEYATLSQATVTHNDMGDMTISTQVKIDGSIAPDFSYDWEVEFKGAKYIHPIREPQASKDNTSLNSTIDLVFQHWAIYQLKRYYFVQLASIESGIEVIDKYNASLGLSLSNFRTALQQVLDFYFPFTFVVDLNPNSPAVYDEEAKFISINYSHIWEVLQKVYETYNVRWDIQPLDVTNNKYSIRIGYEIEEINHIFQYGFEGGLLKVERQVQNSEIRNKLLGRGGSKNLPRLYFKDFAKYGETKDNQGFTPDPDAIPELKDINFTELRCANFRSYVQGWKANTSRDLSYGDIVEEYDEVRGENDFAYRAGYDDTKFNPIEYVKDDESIAKYGVLEGALENNESIYASIQGAMSEYGRVDEVVDVESVLTDYGERNTSDLQQTNVEVTHNSDQYIDEKQASKPKKITFEHKTDTFEIPEGYVGYFSQNPSLISRVDFNAEIYRFSNKNWRYFGRGSGSRSLSDKSKVLSLEIYNADTNDLVDLGNISELPSGRYYAKYEGEIVYDGKVKIQGFEEFDQYKKYELISCKINYTFSLNVICNVLEGENLLDINEDTGLFNEYSVTVNANSTIETNIDTNIHFDVPSSGANIYSVGIYFTQNGEFAEAYWTPQLVYKGADGATIVKPNTLNIEQGTYNLRVALSLKNLKSSKTTFKIQVFPITLYYNVPVNTWKPTFNIWLKNIWGDTQQENESDEAYATRVWSPILGQSEGETAKITFMSGLLSQSSDWDFEIVDTPIVDRTKSIDTTDVDGDVIKVNSEWMITLAKSDAELESINKYIPYKGYNAIGGDKFIFTGIQMPHDYVLWGERRVTESKTKALNDSSNIKPTWIVQTDKVKLQQDVNGQKLVDQITIGKGFTLRDSRWCENNEDLYVQSMTYHFSSTLPEIEVTLVDKPTTQVSTIGRIQGDIKNLTTQVGLISNVEQTLRNIGDRIYLRKDGVEAISDSPTKFSERVSSNNYRQGSIGGSGWALYKDNNGNAILEADKVIVRQDMQVNNLIANQIEAIGGKEVLSSASIIVSKVITTIGDSENLYQCFFEQHQGTIANLFRKNDIAMGQTFSPQNEETKFYKMVVDAVGDNYIVLTSNGANGDGIPQQGDVIVQYGNTEDSTRQFVIIRDVIGGGYERMIRGLSSTMTSGTEYYFAGYDSESGTPRWFVGDAESDYAEWKDGTLNIKGKVVFQEGSSGLENLEEWAEKQQQIDNTLAEAKSYTDIAVKDLQDQLDGKVESFFYDYDPNLDNIPAKDWTTDELKAEHLNDTFTNTETGRSWRWLLKDGSYQWAEIADTQSAEALAKAQEALGVANGKVAVFVTDTTPVSPYNEKDLWLKDGRIYRSTTTRTIVGATYIEDWVLAENSHEYADSLAENLDNSKSKVWFSEEYTSNNAPQEGVKLGDLFIPWDARHQLYSYTENGWELTSDKTQTTINGGLITSGTIQLGDTDSTAKAGITGGGTSDDSVRIWAGDGEANKENAPFRVMQDGKVIATNAEIEGKIKATEGELVNVTVKGSIKSPFVEISSDNYTMPTGSDNCYLYTHMGSTTEPVKLLWDASQSGRKITLVGSFYINAPAPVKEENKQYFFENGYKSEQLFIRSEIVELLGYSRQYPEINTQVWKDEFIGWIVLSRKALETTYPYGRELSSLAIGRVVYNGTTATIDSRTFDEQGLGVSVVSNACRIPIPHGWFKTLDDCIISCNVFKKSGSSSTAISIVPTKYETDSFNGIEFVLYDSNGNRTSGSFEFMIYPLKTWY